MMTLKMKMTQHLMFVKKFTVFKQAEQMSVESPLFPMTVCSTNSRTCFLLNVQETGILLFYEGTILT